MKIQWIGGPSFILELGRFKILGDPVLGQGDAAFTLDSPSGGPPMSVKRLVGLPPIDLDGIDVAVLSRDREDHFDAAAAERLDKNVTIVAPSDAAGRVAGAGFGNLCPLGWWEETKQSQDGETLTVTAVPTETADRAAAAGNGYIIDHVGEKPYTVYWTGDTLWFSGAREIKARAQTVDLFIPHLGRVGADAPGGPFTLDGKAAMQFVFMFQPKRIVPISHGTFSHYTETVDDFKERVALTMYDRRLVVLEEGEVFERT